MEVVSLAAGAAGIATGTASFLVFVRRNGIWRGKIEQKVDNLHNDLRDLAARLDTIPERVARLEGLSNRTG